MPTERMQGFKVLPLKFTKNSEHHYVYFKEHSVRNQTADKPPGKTLFILNIPPYATEESVKRVFSTAGEVENVMFTQTPTSEQIKPRVSEFFGATKEATGFKVAYVIYKTVASLQKALSLTKLQPLSSDSTPVLTGVRKWIQEYNASIPNVENLQLDIDEYMKKFDTAEAKKNEHQKGLGEADEDGWVTVTSKGRNPGIKRKESVHEKINEAQKVSNKRKQLLNFYTFQVRDSKMKHLASLRQKFEEDKKKIALLKQNRRFKPF